MRFAFISDIHLRPGDQSEVEFRACLRHVAKQNPDFLVTGGDHVYDTLWSDRDTMTSQWELYHEVMRQECRLHVEPVIGNHDVWGWGSPDIDPSLGKQNAQLRLGISERYRTFVRDGWRFVVLDSVHQAPDKAYTARLDEEQFTWLEKTLDGANPTVILSHIPIISVTPYFFGENEARGEWDVPGAWMHLDARRLRNLFLQRPEVKLCVAGHMHQVDRVDYQGVTYMVAGSVSGGVWCGDFECAPPGYSIIDLYPNGRFKRTFKTYRRRSKPANALPPE
jgi:3',5'-cyclic AMP phosphodiesterase CpdA